MYPVMVFKNLRKFHHNDDAWWNNPEHRNDLREKIDDFRKKMKQTGDDISKIVQNETFQNIVKGVAIAGATAGATAIAIDAGDDFSFETPKIPRFDFPDFGWGKKKQYTEFDTEKLDDMRKVNDLKNAIVTVHGNSPSISAAVGDGVARASFNGVEWIDVDWKDVNSSTKMRYIAGIGHYNFVCSDSDDNVYIIKFVASLSKTVKYDTRGFPYALKKPYMQKIATFSDFGIRGLVNFCGKTIVYGRGGLFTIDENGKKIDIDGRGVENILVMATVPASRDSNEMLCHALFKNGDKSSSAFFHVNSYGNLEFKSQTPFQVPDIPGDAKLLQWFNRQDLEGCVAFTETQVIVMSLEQNVFNVSTKQIALDLHEGSGIQIVFRNLFLSTNRGFVHCDIEDLVENIGQKDADQIFKLDDSHGRVVNISPQYRRFVSTTDSGIVIRDGFLDNLLHDMSMEFRIDEVHGQGSSCTQLWSLAFLCIDSKGQFSIRDGSKFEQITGRHPANEAPWNLKNVNEGKWLDLDFKKNGSTTLRVTNSAQINDKLCIVAPVYKQCRSYDYIDRSPTRVNVSILSNSGGAEVRCWVGKPDRAIVSQLLHGIQQLAVKY